MEEQSKQVSRGASLAIQPALTERERQAREEIRSALEHAVQAHARAAIIVLEVSSNYAKRAQERMHAVLAKLQRGRSEQMHLACIGRNRFALVIAPVGLPGHARALAEHLTRSLDPRICPLLRRALPYAWSGLAVHPDDGLDADALIAHANQAMARMRSGGARRGGFVLSRRRQVEAKGLRPLAVRWPGSETA
jgi:hypothetical protein